MREVQEGGRGEREEGRRVERKVTGRWKGKVGRKGDRKAERKRWKGNVDMNGTEVEREMREVTVENSLRKRKSVGGAAS